MPAESICDTSRLSEMFRGIRKASYKGFKERLLCRFYVYSFRCQVCRFRFRILQWGIRYPSAQEDRREYERLAMNFPIAFVGKNIDGSGPVSDRRQIKGRSGVRMQEIVDGSRNIAES